MKKRARQLLLSLPVIGFFIFSVILYGPFSLFLPNVEEFWFGLSTVMIAVLSVTGVLLCLLCLLFFFVPEKAAAFLRKLLFGITLGMYVQGNYMNISYGSGVLDGTKIHWEHYTKYGLASSAVWVICLALPFVASRLLKGRQELLERGMMIACAFIVLMQVPAFVFQALSYHPAQNDRMTMNKNGEFILAEDDNILIFILDTMDESYYRDFLEENPEYTENLEGFVHYGNTLASGARTPVAVPSMFTGEPFRQTESYTDYKSRVWGRENSLTALHDAGYDIGFYSETVLFSPECGDYCSNIMTGTVPIGSWTSLIKNLYKMDLYKFMPHYLKRFFLIDTANFDEAIDSRGNYVIRDTEFYSDYRTQGFSVGEETEKAVRIYHLRGAHPAYHLNRNGEYTEEDSTREDVVYAAFKVISEMLAQLRQMGLYDSSTIIITADHGDKNLAEQPIFLLKQKGAGGDYVSDDSPVSLFDLPGYLTALAGAVPEYGEYGMDLTQLTEDTVRERHFFQHEGGNQTSYIDEWKFEGTLYDPDQMQLVKEYGDEITAEEYVLGTTLSFGIEQTGNPYIVDGFGRNTGIRTVLRGPHSTLAIPIADLPEKGNLHVHVTISVAKEDYENTLIITANRQQVFEGLTNKKMKKYGIDFDIPVSVFTINHILQLDFQSPHLSEDEMDLPVKKRTDTIRILDLTIE